MNEAVRVSLMIHEDTAFKNVYHKLISMGLDPAKILADYCKDKESQS